MVNLALSCILLFEMSMPRSMRGGYNSISGYSTFNIFSIIFSDARSILEVTSSKISILGFFINARTSYFFVFVQMKNLFASSSNIF